MVISLSERLLRQIDAVVAGFRNANLISCIVALAGFGTAACGDYGLTLGLGLHGHTIHV